MQGDGSVGGGGAVGCGRWRELGASGAAVGIAQGGAARDYTGRRDDSVVVIIHEIYVKNERLF